MSSNRVLKKPEAQQENLFLSLVFNVVLPVFFLSKMNVLLGAFHALLFSLCFPLFYAGYDFYKRRKVNPISLIGFVSVLTKGSFALFQVDTFWFAVQEAALPFMLGLFTIGSALINKPFVRYFVYNENIFNVTHLEEVLIEKQGQSQFKKLLWQVTIVFGFAFFLGGILNFFLAKHIIISPTGTEKFNQELAKMTAWGYVVVALPKFLISMFGLAWFVLRLKKITGLDVSQMLKVEDSHGRSA